MGPVWEWWRLCLKQYSGASLGLGCGAQSWSLHPWTAGNEEVMPFGMLLSKGSYLLSSWSHHKPWWSCRAFENVLCHCVQAPSRLQDKVWETKKENLPVMWNHCGEATFQVEIPSNPSADWKEHRSVLSPPQSVHILELNLRRGC